jgi:uncharacterized protein YukE
MKIKLTFDELRKYLDIPTPEFPKYTRDLLNLSNRYSQGTRPRVVGQMSDLIQEFPGKTLEEWKQWYLEKHPEAIKEASNKIESMLKNLRNAINQIDRKMVERWVEDLVLVKTFIGLRFQEAILKKIAEVGNTTYRFASPQEEAMGIDGFIGDTPISIKPDTYKLRKELGEEIESEIIYYSKLDKGIEFEFEF